MAPTYIVHAQDDQRVPVQQAIDLYAALCAHHIPAEIHVYEHGKHGFGIEPQQGPAEQWTKACLDWMRRQKIISQNIGN
jgi:dipeptidyl aminopeptidase/acylaminoacyl peptidase